MFHALGKRVANNSDGRPPKSAATVRNDPGWPVHRKELKEEI